MFDMTRHHARQARWRWLAWRADPLYLLFERMYHCDPEPLPSVTPHPRQRGFLLSSFSCPDFARYRGREIAFFNARQVAVYWLPGARHSGGGYVANGEHHVTLAGHALHRPLRLTVHKDADDTQIRAVSVQAQRRDRVRGGFIAFAIIARELQCLVLQWLDYMHAHLGRLEHSPSLRALIEQARQLPDRALLNARAQALLDALAQRAGGRP